MFVNPEPSLNYDLLQIDCGGVYLNLIASGYAQQRADEASVYLLGLLHENKINDVA